jgi:putative phage-type endonuclease
MRVIDCIQGSDEWYEARLGKVTGSCFSKVLAKGQGKTRNSYMIQIAAERLTGLPQEAYSNEVMARGTLVEPQAREAYEAFYGVSVEQVGFCELDDNVGVSPDGLVGKAGSIEIKCPNTTTHIDTILRDRVPPQYTAQIQGLLWITDRKWCDFISFDPRMRSNRIWVKRVERDQGYIDNLKREIIGFILELNDLIEKINGNVPF